MGHGSLRPLIGMAMVALFATTLLFLFSLQQVTDTEAPRVARYVHRALERNLAEESRTTLVVADPRTEDDLRHYVLTFEPAPSIARDDRALNLLVRRAAELTVGELVDRRPAPVLTCVAAVPGDERRVTYSASLRVVDEPIAPVTPRRAVAASR